MRTLAWIYLFAILPSLAFADEDQQVCERYKTINEQITPKSQSLSTGCGPKGYLLNFGYFYCSRFVKNKDYFTEQGKNVMKNIRSCLMHELQACQTPLTCENVEAIGIGSHYSCYMQSGYCGMPRRDKVMLMVFLRGQAINPQAWGEFLRIFKCQ